MNDEYGAKIERGRVISAENGAASVESMSRPGIVTMPLKAATGLELKPGMYVFYFMFLDGSGMIIGEVS